MDFEGFEEGECKKYVLLCDMCYIGKLWLMLRFELKWKGEE